jgi:hypothetical protein
MSPSGERYARAGQPRAQKIWKIYFLKAEVSGYLAKFTFWKFLFLPLHTGLSGVTPNTYPCVSLGGRYARAGQPRSRKFWIFISRYLQSRAIGICSLLKIPSSSRCAITLLVLFVTPVCVSLGGRYAHAGHPRLGKFWKIHFLRAEVSGYWTKFTF